RRRHTRFSRDWSSDVCSSDLGPSRLPCRGVSSREVQGVRMRPMKYNDASRGSGASTATSPERRSVSVLISDPLVVSHLLSQPWQIGRASCRERVLTWVAVVGL